MSRNKSYVKGRAKEYRIIDKLRNQKYDIVFRSAGSHSPIDVVGIRFKDKKITFIQSKPRNISENMFNSLLNNNRQLNNQFNCDFQVL